MFYRVPILKHTFVSIIKMGIGLVSKVSYIELKGYQFKLHCACAGLGTQLRYEALVTRQAGNFGCVELSCRRWPKFGYGVAKYLTKNLNKIMLKIEWKGYVSAWILYLSCFGARKILAIPLIVRPFLPFRNVRICFMIGSHMQGSNLMQDLGKEVYKTKNNIFIVRRLTPNTPEPLVFTRNNKVFRHLIVNRNCCGARFSVH